MNVLLFPAADDDAWDESEGFVPPLSEQAEEMKSHEDPASFLSLFWSEVI